MPSTADAVVFVGVDDGVVVAVGVVTTSGVVLNGTRDKRRIMMKDG